MTESTRPDVVSVGLESGAALSIEDVSLEFGGVRALTGVSLRVAPGETVGLIGPNGAGKSTLVNCIVGLYAPSSGRVLLDGSVITGRPPRLLASLGISRTFQNLRLFPSLTVVENVMIGMHSRSRSGFLAAIFGLKSAGREEAAMRRRALDLLGELGMGELSDVKITSLPYAQQKTVEICRALAAEPRLLLLDEPAAGMSSSERRAVTDLIGALSRRRISILLIEHDVNLVMHTCNRVAVLDHGVKIADGAPDAVRRDAAVIAAYLGEDG